LYRIKFRKSLENLSEKSHTRDPPKNPWCPPVFLFYRSPWKIVF
jgi:hypothetical protein